MSAEYGPGAGLSCVPTARRSTNLWTSDDALSNHYATSVYRNGVLYGFHGRQEFGQSLRAVEFGTGRGCGVQDRFLAGSIMLAGDRLLIMREGGELVLADASPTAFTPVARAQIPACAVRAFPALANGSSMSGMKRR